jgi:hypothetical protein
MTWDAAFDFLKFFLPLAGGAFAWFWNERRKRISEEYERKAEKYAALIESLQGFYIGIDPENGRRLKDKFIQELNKCWLYCSDDVIHKAYAFLNTVHTREKTTDEVKERAVGDLMLAIRRDLLARKPMRVTALTAADFQHLKVN